MKISELTVADFIKLSNQIDKLLNEKVFSESVKKDISDLMKKYNITDYQAAVYVLREDGRTWTQIMHMLGRSSPQTVRVTYGKVIKRMQELDRIGSGPLYLDSLIRDLDLPHNVYNALFRSDSSLTVYDLINITDEELLDIRTIGPKAVEIIRKRLSELPPDIKWSYEA